jgi:hypothetical protein
MIEVGFLFVLFFLVTLCLIVPACRGIRRR